MISRRVLLAGFCAFFLSESESRRILLIGDSLAYGLTRPFKKKTKKIGIYGGAYGIGSTTTSQWARKTWLHWALKNHQPDTTLIVLGTNDSGSKRLKEAFPDNCQTIVEKIQRTGSLAVWITPPKIKLKTDFIYEGAVLSEADHVMDCRQLVIPMEKDRIHPSYRGNIQWIKEIFKMLVSD